MPGQVIPVSGMQVIGDGQDPHQRTVSVVSLSDSSAIQCFCTALIPHDCLTCGDSTIKTDSVWSECPLQIPVSEIPHDPIIIGISDGAIRISGSNLQFQPIPKTQDHAGVIGPGSCRLAMCAKPAHPRHRVTLQFFTGLEFHRHTQRICSGQSQDPIQDAIFIPFISHS